MRPVAEQFCIPYHCLPITKENKAGQDYQYSSFVFASLYRCNPIMPPFERGVKIIGATAHYITTELDAGPIIEQDVVRVTYKDTIDTLVNKGKDLEKIVLSRAVQKHIERKILTYKNKTVIFN